MTKKEEKKYQYILMGVGLLVVLAIAFVSYSFGVYNGMSDAVCLTGSGKMYDVTAEDITPLYMNEYIDNHQNLIRGETATSIETGELLNPFIVYCYPEEVYWGGIKYEEGTCSFMVYEPATSFSQTEPGKIVTAFDESIYGKYMVANVYAGGYADSSKVELVKEVK